MTKAQFKQLIKSKGVKFSESMWTKHLVRNRKSSEVKNQWTKVQVPYNSPDVYLLYKKNGRIKNWGSIKISSKRESHSTIYSENTGRYSSRCTYTKYTHHPVFYSYAKSFGQKLAYYFGRKLYIIKAPRGWLWGKDENGIKIYKRSDTKCDYHPTQTDLVHEKAGAVCAAVARSNRAFRIKQDKELYQFRKAAKDQEKVLKKVGVYACLNDSLNSGNCLIGTKSFMIRNKLSGHVNIARLSSFTDSRIGRVIEYAKKRTLRELKDGICIMSDHYENPQIMVDTSLTG